MASSNSFFSKIGNSWDEFHSLRNKYSDAIPVPQRSYFKPIRSIDDFSTLLVRPIEKPLWLGINTLSFLLKAILSCFATLILAPCALVLALIAPTSNLSNDTTSTFKQMAANTLVSTGMAVIALFSAAISIFLNPVFVVSRAAASVLDSLNSTTESCCGLTIARL